jgi:hypothetical protein
MAEFKFEFEFKRGRFENLPKLVSRVFKLKRKVKIKVWSIFE